MPPVLPAFLTIPNSFPVVLPEFPELAQKGAYSPSQQYSTSDLDDIVAYAAAVSAKSLVYLLKYSDYFLERCRYYVGD